MTLKEFAKMLDGRAYRHEITKEEEALAKELGFVVVFGYSDDNAELRGAIDDEIACYDGGALEHKDLHGTIYADWCPEDVDCSWGYRTTLLHEKFNIYEDGELYCVGIVCDIRPTNADRIRAMSDKELADWLARTQIDNVAEALKIACVPWEQHTDLQELTAKDCLKWLQQPAEEPAAHEKK